MIQSTQRGLHQTLSGHIRAIETQGTGAAIALIGLSFFYGVFHAAGPGHGKIVISTYLLSHESQIRRGILLSFTASLIQGLTAIAIVTGAFWLFELTMRQTQGVTNNVEAASFALIALVGLFIMGTRLLRLVAAYRTPASPHNPAHHAPAHHDPAHHDAACGHSHMPELADLDEKQSLRTFIGIVLSIGIRPCSGAVIVLLLSYSLGLYLAGAFAVLAMSLGTALTISVLAVLSVYLRQIATRLMAIMPGGGGRGTRILDVIGVLGGGILFAFGASLVHAALFAPVHPFR